MANINIEKECAVCYDDNISLSYFECGSKKVCEECINKHFSNRYTTSTYERVVKCLVCEKKEYTQNQINTIKNLLKEPLKKVFEDLLKEGKEQYVSSRKEEIAKRRTPQCVRIKEKKQIKLPLFRQKIETLKNSTETPCCGGYFTDFDGCLAIRCGLCEKYSFCGACYEIIEEDNDHDHISKGGCRYYDSSNVFGNEETVKEYAKKRRIYSVLKAVVFFDEDDVSVDSRVVLQAKKDIVLEVFFEDFFYTNAFENLFDKFDCLEDIERINFREYFKNEIYKKKLLKRKNNDIDFYLEEGKLPPAKLYFSSNKKYKKLEKYYVKE